MMPLGRMVWKHYVPLALGLIAVSFLGMSYSGGAAVPTTPRVRQTTLVARFAAVAPPGEPAYLALQPLGGLVIGDRVRRTITLLAPDGNQVRSFGPDVGTGETLADVAGVAASGADVFVVDRLHQRIVHLDAMGRLVGSVSFQALGTYGAGPLAVDAQGTLYLADTGRGRILVLGQDGSLRRIIGTQSSDRPGQLKQPMGVAVAPDGALYVADVEARRIAWWRPNLDPGGDWPTEYAPWGVTIDAEGRVYVPEPGTRRVVWTWRFRSAGPVHSASLCFAS